MERVITVKGVGKVNAKPDQVTLDIHIKSANKSYEKTMETASLQLDSLRKAIGKCGMDMNDLKTESFGIDTQFDHLKEHRDVEKNVFAGYECGHHLKLQFPMDMKMLGCVLTALSTSEVKPEFSVRFGVADTDKITAELLRDATQNARQKAEILTEAAGVTLGPIQTIDYNMSEVDLYSRTQPKWLNVRQSCSPRDSFVDIKPEDIQVSDTVTFVWGIG